MEWGTPGVWHAKAGTARERVCLGHLQASFDAAPGRRGGGEGAIPNGGFRGGKAVI